MALSIRIDGLRTLWQAVSRLLKGSRAARDLSPAFEVVAEHFYEYMRQVFDTEGGINPSGQWEPLTPTYAGWKRDHYGALPILVAKGDLRASLTGPDDPNAIRKIYPDRVELGSDLRTPDGRWSLWLIHQLGTSHGVPARPIFDPPLSVQEQWRQDLIKRIEDAFHGPELEPVVTFFA